VSLLLLFPGGPAPPAPVAPVTDLQVYAGLPGALYDPFPNRAPATIIVMDPAALTWTGQNLNAPVFLTLDPMALTWAGLNLPELQSITDLTAYEGLPGAPMGPFPPRAPQTTVTLDAMALTWQGQDLTAPGDTMAPADLMWTGQNLLVLEHAAITDLATTGEWPGASVDPIPRRDGVLGLGPGAMAWVGQTLVVATTVILDPADLTLTGQNVPVPSGRLIDLRGLTPLTGVR
jgi:hypothetical protein